MRVHHGGAGPEDGHVVPGVGGGDDGDVDGAWGGGVAEVERRQVEEVDDEEELGEPEPAAHPEHEEAEG